ncbi:metallophosphoesterase family protein [Sphingopyxis sp. MWB1]|uniref:metallophosphoesterase family protein n=1 Tax=Sphingopyxis sp. MWB1 TaxID=1537715 RepID=UPI000519FA08|nr:metallophosphoesterase [Sphingopyxis sp. MWB1]
MMRLFHISDLHFGLEDRAALQWFSGCVRRERPAAVLITGDLTMRARSREFAAACDWIETLDVPVTVEVGNHDLPYFNPFARFLWPYRRFRRIKQLVERELDFPGLAIVPLKTTARAQWRLDWSKGRVTPRALDKTLAAIDALPPGTTTLVTAHHPLVEAGTKGRALTRGGENALCELAARNVAAVLTGHVHDAFDLWKETLAGPIRMIGAGTLSQRVRSTPPSFNQIDVSRRGLNVTVRNLADASTPMMQISDIPPDALPPREAGEPVAPIGAVPPVDPPVH